ncbi:MAG: acyl-CoA dehydrogenase [Actinobacteria bacterium ATB1]|nr:acyl-CoA dehydrogenase [Actinobacteria bacterium ATB1]
MDFDDTPEEAAFRAKARAWLEENAPLPGSPEAWAGIEGSPSDDGEFAVFLDRCREWQRTLKSSGWACLTWPVEFGGQGLTPAESLIWNQEVANFGVTLGPLIPSLGFVGPTIIAHGTGEQKARHIPPIVSGDAIWCQLFSEPGAGSDLANLATRAVPDGDSWVVSGQKVWNSFAHVADWGILIARTDPERPKHRGITYFLVDMRSPGVTVRPIRQISGAAKFNEVFLDEVRIPAGNVVGEANEGWKVVHTTLRYERSTISGIRDRRLTERLAETAGRRGSAGDPNVRQEIARTYVREQLVRYLTLRLQSAIRRGVAPGPEASVLKLAVGEHLMASAQAGLAISGPGSVAGGDAPVGGDDWKDLLLWQYEVRFGGGTEEIQRNTIGEVVLGLPAEPRVDKDLPYSQVRTI